MENYSKDIIQKVIDYALQSLDDLDYDGFTCYACDLHNEVFNTDYVTIGTYDALEEIGENIHDVFEALEQYNDEFGEQYSHVTDPEKMLNLLYYMVGQSIFNELSTINSCWDVVIGQEELQEIIKELKELQK